MISSKLKIKSKAFLAIVYSLRPEKVKLKIIKNNSLTGTSTNTNNDLLHLSQYFYIFNDIRCTCYNQYQEKFVYGLVNVSDSFSFNGVTLFSLTLFN